MRLRRGVVYGVGAVACAAILSIAIFRSAQERARESVPSTAKAVSVSAEPDPSLPQGPVRPAASGTGAVSTENRTLSPEEKKRQRINQELAISGPRVEGPSFVEKWRTVAKDENRASLERVNALKILHNSGSLDAQTAQSFVSLLESCRQDSLRATICRYVRGVDTVELRRALVDRMMLDSSAMVRKTAEETLSDLQAHPEVRAALERARSQKDP